MVIDVSPILKVFGGKIDIDTDIAAEPMKYNGGSFDFTKPISVKGDISNNGTTLVLSAECETAFVTQCARCMADTAVNLGFSVEEALMQGSESADDDEDVIVFEGTSIDIDDIIMNNLILNLSSKYLCREDCRGLCPICGADLNRGDCGCRQNDIDPRWAALADMIKEND